METVYADLLFLIDFSMDFLTLYIVSRVMKQKIKLIRMCSASAMGGVYSVLSLGINVNRWLSLIFDLFVCFVMCMTAFLEKSPNRFPSDSIEWMMPVAASLSPMAIVILDRYVPSTKSAIIYSSAAWAI